MSPEVLKCLVMITHADVVESRVLECISDGGYFLIVPVSDYHVPQALGRKEMRLHLPETSMVKVDGGNHDYICSKIIDLDKFDELPWAE